VNLRRSLDESGGGLFATEATPETARAVLSQEGFKRVIAIERKRTERSHKPFLLVLLSMGRERSSLNEDNGLSKVMEILSQSTRETDVVGWYKNGSAVGVMFTEIEVEEKKQILNTILMRVSTALEQHLNARQFHELSISFHWFPEEWQEIMKRGPNVPPLYPDIAKRGQNRKPSRMLKRAMDILGSLIALILGTPLFVCIALAIKATSKGPVLFRQERVGQCGVPFSLLKFRSMHCGNDDNVHKQYVRQMIAGLAEKKPANGNGQGVYKLTNDSRITRVGAFLRKTSFDELPQFINVLRGEMSLVGPRPPIHYELEGYDLWHRRRVMEAKPGLTGLWQVSGRNRLPFDEMVRLDLLYARTWSPWLDLKILLRTPRAVVAGAH
jgi:lipopolysaccharide/colanic/teichoic acid biosynthesis glycosyltransferase